VSGFEQVEHLLHDLRVWRRAGVEVVVLHSDPGVVYRQVHQCHGPLANAAFVDFLVMPQFHVLVAFVGADAAVQGVDAAAFTFKDLPVYRLEWQKPGSLERRLRSCLVGIRAETPPWGATKMR